MTRTRRTSMTIFKKNSYEDQRILIALHTRTSNGNQPTRVSYPVPEDCNDINVLHMPVAASPASAAFDMNEFSESSPDSDPSRG